MSAYKDFEESRRNLQVHNWSYVRKASGGQTATFPATIGKANEPDATLTSYTQLLTWRLDTERALISLVDKSSQRFIAASVRTSNLNLEETEFGQEEKMWALCKAVNSLEEALCIETLNAHNTTGKAAVFWIGDLQGDSKYNHFSYVKEAPYFRFYAGTPLIAPDGYRIGAVFVIGTTPRYEGLTAVQSEFLSQMAQVTMQYLVLLRESEDRRRISLMSRGLAAFVAGLTKIPDENDDRGPTEAICSDPLWDKFTFNEKKAGHDEPHFDLDENLPPHLRSAISTIESRRPELSTNVDSASSGNTSQSSSFPARSRTHESVFARGASLLRQALNIEYTFFFDTSTAISNTADDENDLPAPVKASNITRIFSPGSEPADDFFKDAAVPQTGASVLSHASRDYVNIQDSRSQEFQGVDHITPAILEALNKHYPEGILWTIDDEGSLISCQLVTRRRLSESTDVLKQRHLDECSLFLRCFPTCRQVLYAPIYGTTTGQPMSAAFCVSLAEVPVFSSDVEISWTRAFLNNISVEYDRVSIANSDEQKSNLIANISHEFRSPLHGLLASADLLAETNLSSFQKELCSTVSICGRTLLNTISHILDYTKINDFDGRSADRQILDLSKKGQSFHKASCDGSINAATQDMFANVDVAAQCEEVVQAVCVGHAHEHLAADISSNKSADRGPNNEQPTCVCDQEVTVTLDIQKADWHFYCIPGAVQRILMNLVRNSLKYTRRGNININMMCQDNETASAMPVTAMITIEVGDTGIGMSKDFLGRQLYAPFRQANSLSPGTGLGMSIIKNVVKSLRGKISVDSQLGAGTVVNIQFSLDRSQSYKDQPTMPSSFKVDGDVEMDYVQKFRSKCEGMTAAVPEFHNQSPGNARTIIVKYLTQWYGLRMIDDIATADLVVIGECYLMRPHGFIPPYAVMVRKSFTTDRVSQLKDIENAFLDWITEPVGPYRLANVLAASLDRRGREQQLPPGFDTHPLIQESPDNKTPEPEALPRSPDPSNMSIQARRPRMNLRQGSQRRSDLVLHSFESLPPFDAPLPTPLLRNLSFTSNESNKDGDMSGPGSPSILCVDDNMINLKLLCTLLAKLSYTNITCANDGQQAFKTFEEKALKSGRGFDIVFMDINMPICDGYQSTKQIRKFEKARTIKAAASIVLLADLGPGILRDLKSKMKACTIMALTGLASDQDRKKAIDVGMDVFISKPLSRGHLKKLMDQWINKGVASPASEATASP